MLPSRGVLRAVPSTRATLQIQSICRPARQVGHGRYFGTSLRSTGAGSGLGLKTGASVGTLRRSAVATTIAIGGSVSARRGISLWPSWGKSTPATTPPPSSTPLDQAAASSSPVPPTVPEVQVPSIAPATPAYDPNVLDLSAIDLDNTSILNIPEQIGYLKTLGIDFGWGPSSVIQWCLEHIHVYSGLPWWGSIALTAVAIRLVLIRPLVIAQETSAKMQMLNRNPQYDSARKRMKEGMMSGGDKNMMMQARQEISLMHKQFGVRPMRAAYGLLQIPLGYGMFRVLNAMGSIPVPGFETGGAAWFQNLSIPDPYFILPMLGPALLFATFRAGRAFQTPEQAAQMKLMMYIIGPVSVLVTMWLPGAVQWYFFVTSALGLAQTSFFQNPRARHMMGLPELMPKPPVVTPGATPLYQPPTPKGPAGIKGVIDGIKDTVHKAKGGAGNYAEANKKKAALSEAQRYHERRTEQERQRFLAKIKEKRQ